MTRPKPVATDPCRVLVVDDHSDTRESLRMLLEMDGHCVEEAADGATALRLAEATEPHVIILDVGLPDADGFDVADRLRRVIGARSFILGLSGHAYERDFERARTAKLDAYFAKPADVEELLRVINEACAEPLSRRLAGG